MTEAEPMLANDRRNPGRFLLAGAAPLPGLLLLAPFPSALAPQGKPAAKPAVSFEEKKLGEIPAGAPAEQRPVFSPSGRKVAFTYREADKRAAVVNGEKLGAYDTVDVPVWTPDGEHVAWRVGNRVEPTRERWWAFLDTKIAGEEDWIGSVAPAPGGAEAAFWANPGCRVADDGTYSGGRWFFFPGARRGREWSEGHGLVRSAWSSDGSRVATVCLREGLSRVLVADKRGETVVMNEKLGPYLQVDSLFFAPDGKLVYAAQAHPDKAGRWYVLWGDEVYGKEWWASGSPVLSADGRHIAYKALVAGRARIVVDRRPLPAEGDAASTPVLSSDGKRVAYAINRGGQLADDLRVAEDSERRVKGGTWAIWLGTSVVASGLDEVGDLRFSADGARLAACARDAAGWWVRCGEDRFGPYDFAAAPCVSSDGKKLAFGARIGRELWWKVVPLR